MGTAKIHNLEKQWAALDGRLEYWATFLEGFYMENQPDSDRWNQVGQGIVRARWAAATAMDDAGEQGEQEGEGGQGEQEEGGEGEIGESHMEQAMNV